MLFACVQDRGAGDWEGTPAWSTTRDTGNTSVGRRHNRATGLKTAGAEDDSKRRRAHRPSERATDVRRSRPGRKP